MIPLRLVLDSNIVVSAALKPDGLRRTIFLLAITEPARLYASPPILAEYRAVLSLPKLCIRPALRRQLLDLVKARAHVVHASRQLCITSDPDDNTFLDCADAARADYLVTGNTRHFPVFWKSTKIITSREFLGLVAPHLLG